MHTGYSISLGVQCQHWFHWPQQATRWSPKHLTTISYWPLEEPSLHTVALKTSHRILIVIVLIVIFINCICIVFSVSFIVCIVSCAMFCFSVVCYFVVMCVTCVLCLIVYHSHHLKSRLHLMGVNCVLCLIVYHCHHLISHLRLMCITWVLCLISCISVPPFKIPFALSVCYLCVVCYLLYISTTI
jgi:hypothetical protein